MKKKTNNNKPTPKLDLSKLTSKMAKLCTEQYISKLRCLVEITVNEDGVNYSHHLDITAIGLGMNIALTTDQEEIDELTRFEPDKRYNAIPKETLMFIPVTEKEYNKTHIAGNKLPGFVAGQSNIEQVSCLKFDKEYYQIWCSKHSDEALTCDEATILMQYIDEFLSNTISGSLVNQLCGINLPASHDEHFGYLPLFERYTCGGDHIHDSVHTLVL